MTTLFKTIPTLAALLSGGVLSIRLILTLQFWFFYITRKFFSITHDYKIIIRFNKKTIPLFLKYPMDVAVLREIFIDKEYEWCPTEDPQVIIDLGAHFGDTALYYHARFPNARIIAVEPSPENFARLVKNTSGISNIVPVQAAVGGHDGEVMLNLVSSSLGHSIMERSSTASSVSVKMMSLETLFQTHSITKADLIKFDIEGAEFDLFAHAKPVQFANAYIGELHFDLSDVDQATFESFFTGLRTTYTSIRTQRFLFTAY